MLKKLTSIWHSDDLLRRVVKNSSYLFSSNAISAGVSVLQSIFAARTLGLVEFGIFGAITSFAAAADKLLSFRMGELVIKYMGQALAKDEKPRAAAIFKAAALVELLTSILSYIIVFLLSSFAATYFAKDITYAPFFVFYALIIPAGFIYETSSAVLQVTGHFRSQAVLNLAQSIATVAIILYAYFSHAGLWIILLAYLVGKSITGIGFALLAFYHTTKLLGPDWWRAPFSLLPPRREFWTFALSSNFSGTVNLVTRDSEVLWVNYFLSPAQGGYYKLALALINLVLMPIDPFIKTSFPEISKAIAEKAWGRLKSLLRRLTTIATAVTLTVGGGLLLVGVPLVSLVYKPEYAPAVPVALILLLGYGTANIFFWNRPLILSLGHPTYPLVVMTIAGLAKVALSFWLVPRFGMYAQAGLMAAFFITSIGLIVWKALSEIQAMDDRS